MRFTVHATLQVTPAQAIFGCDMLFNLTWKINHDDIFERRQKHIFENHERENRLRLDHTYQIGDRVLLNRDILQRKLNPKRNGPHIIQQVYSNSLAKVQLGNVAQKVSIRWLIPHILH